LNYKIILTDEAKEYLISLDVKTKNIIARKIDALKESPGKQGKALSGNLAGYRSLNTAGRYRIVYEVKIKQVIVIIIAVGMRKEGSKIDVYETLKKLLRSNIIKISS